MKTIRQWFETFPEPYRTQAIENTKEWVEKSLTASTGYLDDVKTINSANALKSGFPWYESEQGVDYWLQFHKTLTN